MAKVWYNAKGRFDDVAYHLARGWAEHEKCGKKTIAARLNSCAATVSYWLRSDTPPSARKPRRNPRLAAINERRRLVEDAIRQRTVVKGTRYSRKRRTASHRECVRFPYGSTARAARYLKQKHPLMQVSKTTVWRDLQHLRLKAYVRSRAPRLSANNIKARVAFCKRTLADKAVEGIAFSDEKWFDSQDGRSWQWLSPGEYGDARLKEQGGPRLMVWAVIAPGYRAIVRVPPGEGGAKSIKIDGAVYTRMIRPTLLELRRRQLTFQQDNAPGHAKAANSGFFEKLKLRTLGGWPPNSPDLSPIETLWAIIARRVTERGPFGEDELWEFVEEEFANVSEETVAGLLASFAQRVRICRRERGATVTRRMLAAAGKLVRGRR